MSSKTGDMADKEKGEDETAALPPPLPAQPKAFVFDLLTGECLLELQACRRRLTMKYLHLISSQRPHGLLESLE